MNALTDELIVQSIENLSIAIRLTRLQSELWQKHGSLLGVDQQRDLLAARAFFSEQRGKDVIEILSIMTSLGIPARLDAIAQQLRADMTKNALQGPTKSTQFIERDSHNEIMRITTVAG